MQHRGILKWGLSQEASDHLREVGIVGSQIMQTIGNAAASAGTHTQDGTDLYGNAYAAATDVSVRHPVRLSASGIKALLENLARHGFAAFYRNPGSDHWPAGQAEHIHAIYVGLRMKGMVQDQVHDWLNGRNGLASMPLTNSGSRLWRPKA